jgi:hypothetical protein
MANEFSWANFETDAGLAHYVSGEVHEILYDPTDLRSTARREIFKTGMGSETSKTTKYTRGQVFAAASSEISGGASNSATTTSNFQLNPTRRVMQWQITELWELVAPAGVLDLDLLVGLIIEGTGLTFTDLLCTLFASLSVTAGSTTEQMSPDYMWDAQFLLNTARARPPFHMCLSPHGFNQFQLGLLNAGGVLQFLPATAEMIQAKGPGYKGQYGQVMVWDADSVTLDGGSTYRRSAMYDEQCFKFTEAPVPMPQTASARSNVLVSGLVRVLMEHSGANAIETVYGDYYPSVVEVEDSRGVLIRHLAA